MVSVCLSLMNERTNEWPFWMMVVKVVRRWAPIRNWQFDSVDMFILWGFRSELVMWNSRALWRRRRRRFLIVSPRWCTREGVCIRLLAAIIFAIIFWGVGGGGGYLEFEDDLICKNLNALQPPRWQFTNSLRAGWARERGRSGRKEESNFPWLRTGSN